MADFGRGHSADVRLSVRRIGAGDLDRRFVGVHLLIFIILKREECAVGAVNPFRG